MSMLDAFFNKGFKGAKCKTLLKLTIPRIKLLRNKREVLLKQMRREIAKLLETGQEATARIRVEHIIREENVMAAHEIIELFCELIVVRLPIIETQKECPLDLKEAISSLCFAAPRCADLPELQQVQMLFAAKYGKEFVSAATELLPESGVNRQIIELLSVRAPSPAVKLKLLKEIAEEHELDWDPVATETAFFKPHEDLLDGPTQFMSGSKLPLPKEKHDPSLSAITKDPKEQFDSDTESDSFLDLPEVPKSSLKQSTEAGLDSEIPSPHVASPGSSFSSEATKPTPNRDHLSQEPPHEPYIFTSEPLPTVAPGNPIDQVDHALHKPPSAPNIVTSEPSPTLFSQEPFDQRDHIAHDPHTVTTESFTPSPDCPIRPILSKEKQPIRSVTAPLVSEPEIERERYPSLSRARSDVNVDMQDVLAAAQAAAETAERAAAAARSAASLAQLRISELCVKRESAHVDNAKTSTVTTQEVWQNEKEVSQSEVDDFAHGLQADPIEPQFDSPKTSSWSHHERQHEFDSSHQPQRLPSMEDDPYFSYPNLFNSHDLNPRH
ncbi:hypothetical protein AMTRI_Chr04g189400 [Amborella trichopoda]